MSVKPVVFHPEAVAEAEAAIAWYRERSRRAADALVSDLEKGIEAIQKAPQRWPEFEHNCRRFPLVRFPYLIVCRETTANIEIVAVAHGRRWPGYWRSRSKPSNAQT